MGHRLSKLNLTSSSGNTTSSTAQDQDLSDTLNTQGDPYRNTSTVSSTTSSSTLDESSTNSPNNLYIGSTTVTVPGQSASQKFVIKIQLTKMEPGNFQDNATVTRISSSVTNCDNNNITGNLDNNLNLTRPMVNVTFMKNIQCDPNDHIIIENQEEIKLNNLDATVRMSHSFDATISNNFVNNFSRIQLNDNEEIEIQHHINNNELHQVACSSNSHYHERDHRSENNIQHDFVAPISVIVDENDEQTHCCKRRKTSTPYPPKWRCCKCTCNSSANDMENGNEEDPCSNSTCVGQSKSTAKGNWAPRFNCAKSERPNDGPDMAMWMPPDNAAFLSLSQSNQNLFPTFARCPEVLLVTLNYPQSVVVGPIEDLDERDRSERIIETEPNTHPIPDIGPTFANVLSAQKHWPHILCSPTFGPIVHSQVDYIHCLVPDLNKITNSSFYWGKMDRYEAERLLEGKAEGTFLLRDSAQEEYLFSVTFRKYGRSLHARIEQFNHKFSFDCHDPGVFTASTVTGLLEHYKDPSCVMFFEPMLTIPLHRNFTFSLQQLCRATIVSHTTYDGINELHLPNSLKAYLKEYHYKLRVRVKPFDVPFYSCS